MQYEIFKKIKTETRDDFDWRWRLVRIATGNIISVSAEGFRTKEDCENSIHLSMLADYSTPILEIEEKIKQSFMAGLARKSRRENSTT